MTVCRFFSCLINTVSIRSPLISGTYRILNAGTPMIYNGRQNIDFNDLGVLSWTFYAYYFYCFRKRTISMKPGQSLEFLVEYLGVYGIPVFYFFILKKANWSLEKNIRIKS